METKLKQLAALIASRHVFGFCAALDSGIRNRHEHAGHVPGV
jgi:hypothetical protein